MKYRDAGNERTLLLVHGLGGDKAWQPLLAQLTEHPALQGWDIHSFEYPAKWWPRLVRYGLALSPTLTTVADLFRSSCRSTLGRYDDFAILAHSAGGLIVQRALLDSEWLTDRTSHVALFGTPTRGLRMARAFRFVNPQARDMATGSQFLKELQDFQARFSPMRSFAMRIVAAEVDKTVRRESVFNGFPKSIQRTVPGDHLSMIQPQARDVPVVSLIVNFLTNPRLFLSYVREDATSVLEVFRVLESREFAPWIDQRRLEPGEVWERSIMRALQGSDRFLVFLSEDAIAELSNSGGVFRQEVETAISIQKCRDSQFVIPVRIQDRDLPAILAEYQCFDLFSQGSEGLADSLERSTLRAEVSNRIACIPSGRG